MLEILTVILAICVLITKFTFAVFCWHVVFFLCGRINTVRVEKLGKQPFSNSWVRAFQICAVAVVIGL